MADKFFNITLKPLDPAQIRAAVSETLIEGARPSEWWRRQRTSFIRGVMDTVRQGMNDGLSNAQIARQLQAGAFARHRSHANALSATAINAISNRARVDSFRANDDVIKGYQQISTLDNRTSKVCIAYSGQAWDLDGNPIPPSTLPFNGGPPRHFNCRSSLAPVLKSFEELGLGKLDIPPGTRASIDGQIPGNITFDQFLKTKSNAFQDRLLGPARAKLWREGKISLTQLVDMRGNPLSVEELQALAKRRRKPRAEPTQQASNVVPVTHDNAPEGVNEANTRAFGDTADEEIRRTIQKARPLYALRHEQKGAFYRGGWGINMFQRSSRQHDDYDGVYAHEYGHFIDDIIGQSLDRSAGKGFGYISARAHDLRAADMRGVRKNKTPTTSSVRAGQAYQDEFARTIKNRRPENEASVAKSLADNGVDYEQLKVDLKRAGWKDDDLQAEGHRIAAAMNANDPGAVIHQVLETFARTNTKAFRLWVNVADFFGAMTKNKIGFGHSNSYYGSSRRAAHAQNTEMFTNYFALRAQYPAFAQIVKFFSPQWTKDIDNAIKEFLK